MKKHLALIALMMAAAVVTAQEKGRGDHQRGLPDKMKSELSLTDNQYERIKAIDDSYRERFHDLKMDSAKSREDTMNSMRELRESRKNEIENVLTEGQKAEWQEQQNARREQQRAYGQKVADDRAERLRKELSLSDQQFQKFREANAQFHQRAMGLKKKKISSEDRKAEFGKLRKDYEKSVKSILNKDQYKQWTAMKKSHRPHNGPHMRFEGKGS